MALLVMCIQALVAEARLLGLWSAVRRSGNSSSQAVQAISAPLSPVWPTYSLCSTHSMHDERRSLG